VDFDKLIQVVYNLKLIIIYLYFIPTILIDFLYKY